MMVSSVINANLKGLKSFYLLYKFKQICTTLISFQVSINLDKGLNCFILSSALLEANHKDFYKEHSLLRFFIISDICPLLHEPNLNRVHSFVQCVIRVPLHQVFGGIFNSFLVIFLCIFDIFKLTLEVELEPLCQRMHLLCLLCRFLHIIFFLLQFVYRLDIVG